MLCPSFSNDVAPFRPKLYASAVAILPFGNLGYTMSTSNDIDVIRIFLSIVK
jgi:hypothetical protein